MGYEFNKELVFKYEYDFAKDGGTVGVKTLRNLGLNGLNSELVIEDVKVLINAPLDDDGESAVVSFGYNTDPDYFIADLMGETGLVEIDFDQNLVIDSANKAIPVIEITEDPLIDGKITVIIRARRY